MLKVYINYTSNYIDERNNYCYKFWYYGSSFDIKSDESFCRGDVVEIISIEDCYIFIRKTQRLSVEEKLPILLFCVSRIPLDINSNYEFSCENSDDKILVKKENIKNRNKSYFLIFLCNNYRSKMLGIDKNLNSKIEFLIEE